MLIILSAIALLLGACNSESVNSNSSQKENVLTIYTSIYPLKDFTEKIGGDFVHVESIIPAGADSHTYEPISKEIIEIAKADAFIYNGFGIEAFAETIKDAIGNESIYIVEASRGVETIEHNHEEHDHGEANEDDENREDDEHKEQEHSHNHGDTDPHIWLDPYRAITLAENIKEALIELKPEEKDTFEQNYETLKANLEELDSQFHTLVNSKHNPEMIVSHAAYGYWEESYGIKQIPIAGLSPSEEPSQSELKELVQLAKEHDISYIIFEYNVTPSVTEIIREEINAEAMYLHNLETLTSDDIENEEDYFSLMKANLETLDEVLQ